MSDLTIGLLSALLATNQPQAVSNLVQEHTGISVPFADGNDPAEKELRDVMVADDAALAEVNDWINTNAIARTNTPALKEFNQRINARLNIAKQGYETFLRNHPDSAHGFLAYGSFLNDIGDEEGAKVQYENSKQLDPKNPAVWNQSGELLRRIRRADQCLCRLRRSHPARPDRAGVLPEFRHDGLSLPQGRARNFTASASSRFSTRRSAFTNRP